VQAQVLNLLRDMQQRLGLTVLFVGHDLAVVRQLCTRVAVLEHGRLVEQGSTADVLDHPQHPYTQSLLAAAPVPDPVAARTARRQRLGAT
jgi:oligopeptide transport system ATP-binding protein